MGDASASGAAGGAAGGAGASAGESGGEYGGDASASGAAGAAKHELDKPLIFEANQLFGSSPDLRSDFATPAALRPTFNTADEGREGGASPMWSVFSLGEDEAGLPFHSHGAAWLGVVADRAPSRVQ